MAFQHGSGLDALAATPLSNIPFTSDAFFECERAIWRDSWLLAGREGDVVAAGDYLSLDIKVLGQAIAVVRGRDGRLRGFHNVCPHRGGQLFRERRGHMASVVCPFHGWAFGLDGSLRGISEPQLFTALPPRETLGLKPVAVDTWGGFVFVNLAPCPALSLGDYLQGLPPMLEAYLREPPWAWYTGYQHRFRANWKDLMNIQHEGYHASHLHRQTLGVNFAPADCSNTVFPDSPGVCSLLTVLRPQMDQDPATLMSEVQRLAMRYGTTSNWVDQDTSTAADRWAGAVNHSQSSRWVFDCYTFFPNLLLFVGKDVLSVMRVWPVDAHTADWEWDWFHKDPLENFGNLFNREQGRLATRNALSEDWPMAERAHANLCSGVIDHTWVAGDMEATVRAHYDKLLAHPGLAAEALDDAAG